MRKKIFPVFFGVVFLVFAGPVFSASPYWNCVNSIGDRFSSNQEVFLNFWLNKYRKFIDVIPQISPKEEAWLRQELSADLERRLRAMKSIEYSMRELRDRTESAINSLGSALRSVRSLNYDGSGLRKYYGDMFMIVYEFSEPEFGSHVGRLFGSGVIRADQVPNNFLIIGKEDNADAVGNLVNYERLMVVNHISQCLLAK